MTVREYSMFEQRTGYDHTLTNMHSLIEQTVSSPHEHLPGDCWAELTVNIMLFSDSFK